MPLIDVLVGAIGYGMVLALLYVVFFGDVLRVSGEGALPSILRTSFVTAASVVMLVVVYKASDRFARIGCRRTLWVSAIVLAAVLGANGLPLGADFPPALSCAMCIVAGAATALLGVAWSEFVATRGRHRIIASFSAAFLVAGIIVFSLMLVDVAIRCFGLVLLCLVQAVFLVALLQAGEASSKASRDETRATLRLSRSSSFSYGLTSVLIGYLIVDSAARQGAAATYALIGVGFAGAAVLSFAVSRFKGGAWVLLGPIERFTFPPIIALVLLYSRVPPLASCVILAVLFALLLARDLSRIVNRSILFAEFRVQSCYVHARTELPFAIGLFVGVAAYGLAFALGVDETQGMCSIALAFLIALGVMVAPYGSDSLTMPWRERPSMPEGSSPPGLWRKACDEVAERFGLTARESEILGILSRGRSANVVSRELEISVYTVKSHMQNIYRKMAIETHQELIDCVEDTWMHLKQSEGESRQRL